LQAKLYYGQKSKLSPVGEDVLPISYRLEKRQSRMDGGLDELLLMWVQFLQ